MRRVFFISLGLLIFSLTVRLFFIESIPGEWFGDISNVHEYVTQILKGDWPFYFFQSPGPLYHYLITPIVMIFPNHGYETYKIASIIVSIFGLAATFIFVTDMFSITLAAITTLTMSFSLWFLIWSRLGNSQIVIPAIISLLSFFLSRYIKAGKRLDLIYAASVASLGWYTYPHTFIFPFAFFTFLLLALLIKRKLLASLKDVLMTFLVLALLFLPFLHIIRSQRDGNFSPTGYVGQKVLPILAMPKTELIGRIADNTLKTALMLHVRGDNVFRINISTHPQLDMLAGLFFFAGIFYFFKRARRFWFFYMIFMVVVLVLPSISPAIPSNEVPNANRTIAITPFIYLLVSAGFYWVYGVLKKILGSLNYLPAAVITCLFTYMVYNNLQLYFIDYTKGLPDDNLAPGKIIARFVDNYPSQVALYFASCCWGEAGEPENKGIMYPLIKTRVLVDHTRIITDCKDISLSPALILVDPKRMDILEKFRQCSTFAEVKEVKTNSDMLVARLIYIK